MMPVSDIDDLKFIEMFKAIFHRVSSSRLLTYNAIWLHAFVNTIRFLL